MDDYCCNVSQLLLLKTVSGLKNKKMNIVLSNNAIWRQKVAILCFDPCGFESLVIKPLV
jgi:hypothetical protein